MRARPDYVIVDTAGRLHTKTNLMAELEKMRRTAARVIPDAPHEVLLVLEATTGQNGLEQARKFTESSARNRHHSDQARRDRERRRGGRDLARVKSSHPLCGRGRAARRPAAVRSGKLRRFALRLEEQTSRNGSLSGGRARSGRPRCGPHFAQSGGRRGGGARWRGVGRGFHTWAGVKHAEVLALEEAGESARGATLYVTLEPCTHYGRTPPCIDAILAAGIRKVVAPIEDPNPQVSGRGFMRLRDAGVEVELDASARIEAAANQSGFLHFMRTGRPLVTLKAAVTLDGKIAAPEDEYVPGHAPEWITSETARAHVQSLRHQSDAILTGIGTVLADDCRLTDRTAEERSRPLLRIVLDSLLRLPPESRLATSCRGDVLVATTSAASPERRSAWNRRAFAWKC